MLPGSFVQSRELTHFHKGIDDQLLARLASATLPSSILRDLSAVLSFPLCHCWRLSGFGRWLVYVAETAVGRLMRMMCFEALLTPSLTCKPQQHPNRVKVVRIAACELFSDIGSTPLLRYVLLAMKIGPSSLSYPATVPRQTTPQWRQLSCSTNVSSQACTHA